MLIPGIMQCERLGTSCGGGEVLPGTALERSRALQPELLYYFTQTGAACTYRDAEEEEMIRDSLELDMFCTR